ncbi:MAG: hypothetical protein J07HX5_01038 [halophilic archaeon J07HX5]|nr:MAG: hypothetical protein J07HX5_01038 [halophilic archaeon J07HX5]
MLCTAVRSESAIGVGVTASLRSSWVVTPRSRAIRSNDVLASVTTRSMPSAVVARASGLAVTQAGATFAAPGSTDRESMVPTVEGSSCSAAAVAVCSISRANAAAAASALSSGAHRCRAGMVCLAGDGRDDADIYTGLLKCCILFDVQLEKASPPFGSDAAVAGVADLVERVPERARAASGAGVPVATEEHSRPPPNVAPSSSVKLTTVRRGTRTDPIGSLRQKCSSDRYLMSAWALPQRTE